MMISTQENRPFVWEFDSDRVHKATSIHLQIDVNSMLKSLPKNATIYIKTNINSTMQQVQRITFVAFLQKLNLLMIFYHKIMKSQVVMQSIRDTQGTVPRVDKQRLVNSALD